MTGMCSAIAPMVNIAAEPLPWHRHPLLAVVTGFVLSGVLLTSFSRRLQKRASDEEVRRAVVRDMTEAAHQMLQAVQATEVNTGAADMTDLNAAWSRWKTTAAVISSRLRLYFMPHDLTTAWEQFVHRMDNLYAMQEQRDPTLRGRLVMKALSPRYAEKELTTQEQEYISRVSLERVYWSRLRDDLLDDLARLEEEVLRTKVASA